MAVLTILATSALLWCCYPRRALWDYRPQALSSAFYVQNWALSRISPTRVSLLMGSEPLFGALFAVLWLSEELSLQAWIGGLLIVAATLWTSLARR